MFRKTEKPHRNPNRAVKLRRSAGLILLLGILPAAALPGAETPLSVLSDSDMQVADTGLRLFIQARESIWSNTGSRESSLALLDRAARYFNSLDDAASRNYLLARVELHRGRAIIGPGTKAQMRAHYKTAMDLAEASLADFESSETYRVLADAASSWMVAKGLVAIIKTAPRVMEWSDAALRLDPSNALAIILSAQGQTNAPAAAGGNPREAARRLLALSRRQDLDKVEEFWTLVSLAGAHAKLRERDEAKRRCAQARAIYPNSIWVEECL